MVPLELFSDTLRTVSKLTPHAWAYEAFAEIQRHDGTLVDILPQLAALTTMAVVALVVGHGCCTAALPAPCDGALGHVASSAACGIRMPLSRLPCGSRLNAV